MNSIDIYIEKVLSNIVADEKMKNRIKEDLYSYITEAGSNNVEEFIATSMGSPVDVAAEFMNNMYEDKKEIFKKLLEERTTRLVPVNSYFEYKSKRYLFGLPLVHIKCRYGYGFVKPAVAKGIFAFGEIAIGFFSVGAISLGLVSIGAVSLGILAAGAIAIGAIATGAIAIGGIAIGALAIGVIAKGALAIGVFSYGALAYGKVAVGKKAIGEFTIQGDGSKEQIVKLVKNAYPKINDKIINFITLFLK